MEQSPSWEAKTSWATQEIPRMGRKLEHKSHSAVHLRSYLWPLKMGPTAAPETSSINLPYTPCKIPKTKNQYSFHGESLKSG
jgi:hypothetical protein